MLDDKTPQRLQKLMAQAGYGSRRGAEKLITDGRVMVNRQLANLGDKITIGDFVSLDGRPIDLSRYIGAKTQVLILNKESGVICSTKDDKGRKIVFKLLPKEVRWVMVGRLDINTSGLLLFTNHGELARRLMHPSFEIVREYAVRILGKVEKEHIDQLTKGVELEEGIAKFSKVKFMGGEGANRWYKVSLASGKNREVRRLWEALDFKVSRLIRIAYGEIKMPDNLRANQSDYLSPRQINALFRSVDLPEMKGNSNTAKGSPHNNKS